MSLVEFQVIYIDEDKEIEDKERCKNLKIDYDPSEMEVSSINRYVLNLSYPIISITEIEAEYKGVKIPAVKVVTTMASTPYLLVSYEDFINLCKYLDKNFNLLAPTKIYNQDGNIISDTQQSSST